MTVTYTAEVATVRGLGCFLQLLKRWKGSIYKLVWMDLAVYLTLYYCLNGLYRFVLDEDGKELFQAIVQYCKIYIDLIPLSFVLGFYVSIVMTRWWGQYTTIPFPDNLAVYVSTTVHGQDERGRVMRRTIMRYVCTCITMTFTMISPKVKKRFPTLDYFIDAGLLQQNEKEIIEDLNKKSPAYSKQWLPIVWAASIITRARKEGRIRDDFAVKTIIDELNKIRGQCGMLLNYDHISVPLVYTQVVTIAVYSYFLTTLMGHQWIDDGNNYTFDVYMPIFTLLQFFFYMGWLKVAESLINPFGEDDDDFEVNWMVDRNMQVSYLIVDEMHHEHPQLLKDQYWDQMAPVELPYTANTIRETHPLPSTANIATKVDTIDLTPSSIKIDDFQSNDMNSGPITFTATGNRNFSSSMRSRGGSFSTSVPDGSMTRVNSVSSMLKRFFSRDESKPDNRPDSRMGSTQELINLTQKPKPKLAPDVIEEVDEQLTITSQRSVKESRPSVIGHFSSPSDPIDIPSSYRSGETRGSQSPLSKSAPVAGEEDEHDHISIGGSETDPSDNDDEFVKLKKKRSEERINRLEMFARFFKKLS
ncbi:bestrophin-2 isoform X2 [Harmonia axyridis]|uniref:bestrophin-2 isoform X2 n=1 Tax=Harmonia axyridis TaxID=115357 RepID=UPI001E277C6C|nr:bestrophin-2 isoform X2 [Harmonia axyridis]XP_045479850.1 bestrophin-2 isoform X2 [Harmonia axyridis]